MEKEKKLEEIRKLLEGDEITKKDLFHILIKENFGKDSLKQVFSFFGGFIIFLWIVFLAFLHWESFWDIGQVFLTLWSWLVFYLIWVFLILKSKNFLISNVFLLLSAFLLPVGVIVFESNFLEVSWYTENLFYSIMFAIFALCFFLINLLKNLNFIVFWILAFGSLSYIMFIGFLDNFLYIENISYYTYMILGVFHIFFWVILSGWFYNKVGVFASWIWSFLFFVSFFWLCVKEGIIVELLYFAFLIFAVFVSIRFFYKPFLVFSLIFLVIYIFYITSEHFEEFIAWPVSLIVSGTLLIVIPNYLGYKNKN